MTARPPSFVFSSVAGYTLLRHTLRDRIPYCPHDYQLEGVCQLLDGNDLIAVLATGSGKTAYYLLYILMLVALSSDSSLCTPSFRVPTDPCIVIVYPTNGLEEEQAAVFERVGIRTLVINSGTLEEGRKAGEDLWVLARSGITAILLSPEQLTSPRFDALLQHPAFQDRVCALGIDEIHLLYSWGQTFRQSFRQLGHVRARFPSRTRIIGTTATLLAGHPEQTVLSFVGLRDGEFHFLRRSNVRRNVQTIFRTSTHGLGGWSYPDLDWILQAGRKTVIHCRTISQSFRVAVYLWHVCPPSSERSKRVRMYNALHWPSYNAETRRLMQEDPDAQVIIATASFMVGLDLPNIADIVIVGNLVSADEHVQWEGRPGRDPTAVRDARCITYVTKKSMQTARALLDGKAVTKPVGGKKGGAVQMELSMARLLLAPCATAAQDELYKNPAVDPPCACAQCTATTVAIPSSPCRCSGCVPEEDLPPRARKRRTMNPVPPKQRLIETMRKKGKRELEKLRLEIYRMDDSAANRALPPDVYLPDITIKLILDRFALLDSPSMLQELIADRTYLAPFSDRLWTKIEELRGVFLEMRKAKEAADRDERKAKAAKRDITRAKDAGNEDGLGEYPTPVLSSLDEGISSFQLEIKRALCEQRGAEATGESRQDCAPEPVEVQWKLGEDNMSIQQYIYPPPATQVSRKRSNTVSSINPRPRRKARSSASKENVPPEQDDE